MSMSLAVMETELPDDPDTGTTALPDIADETVITLVEQINRQGFGVLPNYVPPALLAQLQAFVTREVEKNGGQYTCFTGLAALAGTELGDIASAPPFISLLQRLYQQGTGKRAPKQSLYQVLRCLKGETGLVHSLNFHYDSYVVTALLPIVIPQSGATGDLLMLKNRRSIRSNYLHNVVDKLLLDNKLTQKLLRYAHKTKKFGLMRVMMIPGNLYFFWGYNTVLANEPCDASQLRSTALFHFADPHANSAVRRFTGKAAVRAEADA